MFAVIFLTKTIHRADRYILETRTSNWPWNEENGHPTNQDSEKELEQKLNTPPPKPEAKPEQKKNPHPALKIEETLIKPRTTQTMENLSLAARCQPPQEINNLILKETIVKHSSTRPFAVCKSTGWIQATWTKQPLYLLVAQLRLEFDTNRWRNKDPQQTKTEDLNAKNLPD